VGLCGVYRGIYGEFEGLIAGKPGSHTWLRLKRYARSTVGAGLPAKAPVQSPAPLSGATLENFKRQTVVLATVAPLYDNNSQAGMPTATP